MVDFLNGGKLGAILEGIRLQPFRSFSHLLVEVPVLLQVLLELLIIKLYYLQFLLG